MKLITALILVFTVGCMSVAHAEGDGFTPVDSSKISGVKYDGESLVVQFVDGSTATHEGVPQKVFDQFMNSPLKNGFYLGRIDSKYPAVSRTTVEPEPVPEVDPDSQQPMLFDIPEANTEPAAEEAPAEEAVAPAQDTGPLVVGGMMGSDDSGEPMVEINDMSEQLMEKMNEGSEEAEEVPAASEEDMPAESEASLDEPMGMMPEEPAEAVVDETLAMDAEAAMEEDAAAEEEVVNPPAEPIKVHLRDPLRPSSDIAPAEEKSAPKAAPAADDDLNAPMKG